MAEADDAAQCLKDYALRWRIEDWHRILKTGCRVEDLAHQRIERLERAIAINLVIAWRIMVMTLLGRKTVSAKPPTSLGEAIILVARLGGYTNRNNDPPPGHELMWYGYQNLNLMCMGYELQIS